MRRVLYHFYLLLKAVAVAKVAVGESTEAQRRFLKPGQLVLHPFPISTVK